MSRRKNKKKLQEEDQQLDKAEKKSKWASVLNQKQQDQEIDNAAALYQREKKQIFNFDFSKEHLLLNQKDPPKRQQPKIILTAQEQQQLKRRLAKQKQEKQEKQKIKRQKKHQRKKIVQKQKQIQKVKKQEEQKQQQQLQDIVKSNKSNSDTTKIVTWIFIIFIVLGILNYQKQIYVKLSKFKLSDQVNYYELLETNNGATDLQLKTQYKKLVLRYHPDKNPNCHTCKDKFKKIMDAWQILGNPQKKKHYDQNSGFIKQIQSQSLTLNRNNYAHMLDNSDDIWIIQVYDSTNQYCHYFSQFWEGSIQTYKTYIKFGRIDVWHQSEMKGYIPYNFQVYPGLYSMHGGKDKLCQLDYDRPMKSIDFCIQKQVKRTVIPIVNDQSEIKDADIKKIQVILGGAVGVGIRMKLIHAKYQRYIDFYSIKNKDSFVRVKGKDYKFDYNSDSGKKIFEKYNKFLEGLVIQEKSMCEVYYYCKESPCLLLLETPISYESIYPYPVYKIREDQTFKHKIQTIKNSTGLFERFQLGLYQDGKIELGNFDEIADLNAQNGQVIELECIQNSIFNRLFQLYKTIAQKFK